MNRNLTRIFIAVFVSQLSFSSSLYAKSLFLKMLLRIFCCLPINAVSSETVPVRVSAPSPLVAPYYPQIVLPSPDVVILSPGQAER